MGIPALRFLAHCGNLLFQDLAANFNEISQQAQATQQFFSNVHQAHIAYEKAKANRASSGTKLRAPAETRWALCAVNLEQQIDNRGGLFFTEERELLHFCI